MRRAWPRRTARALSNLDEVLKSAGSGPTRGVKTTVFVTDLFEFSLMNEEYARHFIPPFPARSAVQVSALPKETRRGAKVRIDAIAVQY